LERGGEPEDDPASVDERADDMGPDAEARRSDEKTSSQGGKTSEDEDDLAGNKPPMSRESAEDRGEGRKDSQGDELQQERKERGEPQDGKDAPAGREDPSKGPPGAGEEQQPRGAPESQPDMKPGEKQQPSPSPREQSDATEPPAGARAKKDSDSQGEQGGDRAGGGEEGGGQQAPREGTGSAGQNQPADEGAGQSAEPGAGTDSPDAGKEAPASDRTGQPDERTRGDGSEQRDGEGQEPGGKARDDNIGQQQGDKETGRQSEGTQGEDAPTREPRDTDDSAKQGGVPTGGGGETGTAAGAPPSVDGTAPEGDEANLEYARKQTDLVLEKLAEQLNRKQVDEELLEELGWSEEDLRRFVARWQSRKEAAQRSDQSGKAARRELDEALRSLGLRRGPLQQGPLKEDALRDLREGYRGAVPLEYQERLRAYNEGVSRARRDGE
jgi:hypothetical protein